MVFFLVNFAISSWIYLIYSFWISFIILNTLCSKLLKKYKSATEWFVLILGKGLS
ncbi:hypothetical protein GLOIN_2v1611723 [Rhizophagus irregularis DAOM 181602=DAOM 197198]|uniref:Uncharacterized protein n=1 Tax=Rhizophagus irregularis (strain DAOM 181602 / DAOM 197198 / MUCL 43194) TaxID=747089 RepID=A0A2P4PZT5_RHIID|nr:hypothetical protein GLOIN_2v1611723 [Rhizophagus irregularis DAOM 181602=DAOM 197198]POG70915.1 hypothetical protein GLOIN_2v1611723 [Rhizophagus irregularis DAOM 181602=DAOM 197198]|eukprot:XP_025177781.1 hypothetical protein GLOIN_2v1611723 [Rhizophagus irregularis DAOM 181602=DAOM 197198]